MKNPDYCLFKGRVDGVRLNLRVKVAISAAHRFGLVANNVVNDPLVYALVGQSRNEAMPKDVIASKFVPFRMTGEGVLQMVMGLVASQRAKCLLHACLDAFQASVQRGLSVFAFMPGRLAAFLAPRHFHALAKQHISARVDR